MVLQNTFAVIPSFSSKSSALIRPSFLLLLLFDDEDDANKLSRSRFEPISFLYCVVICSLLFSLFLSTKKKKGCRFAGGALFIGWKCARPPFFIPMGVVHRTREKKKNKRAKSVCSLARVKVVLSMARKLLFSRRSVAVMCCFQCEVNKHRQKRARDYFEGRVNKNEGFLCFCRPPKKEAQNHCLVVLSFLQKMQ